MQVFRARWIEAIFNTGRGNLGRPLKINVCPQTSQPQIGRNLWLYLIQWLQLPWKKFMALALPVFLFLWEAYSGMERQVIEFQKFPMVQKFGVSLEQMWCWGRAWNEYGILRMVFCWILNKIPPSCNEIWRARLEPAHSTLFCTGVTGEDDQSHLCCLCCIFPTWFLMRPSPRGWGESWEIAEKPLILYWEAWRIPWTEEPGRLQSMGLQRVRHDWVTFTSSRTVFAAVISLSSCFKIQGLIGRR